MDEFIKVKLLEPYNIYLKEKDKANIWNMIKLREDLKTEIEWLNGEIDNCLLDIHNNELQLKILSERKNEIKEYLILVDIYFEKRKLLGKFSY